MQSKYIVYEKWARAVGGWAIGVWAIGGWAVGGEI